MALRTAIVGCGKVGETHAMALRDLPESRFAAVCDTAAGRSEQMAARYGVQAYQDVEVMIREAGIEAIMVCTPHPLHEEPTVIAAEQGVHVLIEKPMASSLAACDRMLAAAAQGGAILGVVSQRRLFEPVQRMKAAIDAGKIGRPVLGQFLMYSWRDPAYYLSDPWRGKWETEGGGVLVNQSPHQLDLLQWFMGDVEEVTGYWGNLNHPSIEVDDTAVAIVKFRGGGLGSILTSLSQKPGIYTKVHLHGENGASVGVQTDTGASFVAGVSSIVEPPFNDIWTIPGEVDRLGEWVSQDRQHFASIDATTYYHRLQIQEFLQAVEGGRDPLVPGVEGRKVVEIFTAIYRSHAERRPIRFPLDL